MLVRSTSVPAMGTRTGRKNVDDATKFAIMNIVRTGMKQINVAAHSSIN